MPRIICRQAPASVAVVHSTLRLEGCGRILQSLNIAELRSRESAPGIFLIRGAAGIRASSARSIPSSSAGGVLNIGWNLEVRPPG